MAWITYIAAAAPRSIKAAGLIKVGQSRDPEKRARGLACRLIATTSLPELTVQRLLAPFLVPADELVERGYGRYTGGSFSEWFYDGPRVRELVAWLVAVHPADPTAMPHVERADALSGLQTVCNPR